MRRKVVKQGAATLMVSLPRSWTKKNTIEKGDEVNIEEIENKIIVTNEYSNKAKKATISLTDQTESSIRTAIVNAYRNGFTQMQIQFKVPKQYQFIQQTIKDYMIGFEISFKDKKSCIIENITEPSQEQFNILLRKLFYNIILLLEVTYSRLEGKKEVEGYKEITLKVHQYDNFCRRVIARKYLHGASSSLWWNFLSCVIHGQREIYHLNRLLDKLEKIDKQALDYLEQLKKIFRKIQEAYTKKDITLLEKVHAQEKELIYKEGYNYFLSKKNDPRIIFHIASAIKHMYLAASPLLGIILADDEKSFS